MEESHEPQLEQTPPDIVIEPDHLEVIPNGEPIKITSDDLGGVSDQSPEAAATRDLNNVARIGLSYGTEIKDSEAIREFVEEPLIGTCKILYDKNIQTVGSNANLESEYPAYVYIAWDSLSPENRQIAERMGLHPREMSWGYHGDIIEITMPINENTTIDDVSSYFESVANKFTLQDPSWMTTYTLEQLKELYTVPQEMDVSPEKFENYYYDPDSRKFYLSEEHFQKVKTYEILHGPIEPSAKEVDAK